MSLNSLTVFDEVPHSSQQLKRQKGGKRSLQMIRSHLLVKALVKLSQ